jgi:nucleoid-associated protein YgaU
MRFSRGVVLVSSALVLSGCGYVHFGRLPLVRSSDDVLLRAHADLSLEQKILKQELALSRKETDTLRAAMERTAPGEPAATSHTAQQLEQTTRELEAVRADLTRLQAERIGASRPADSTADADLTALQAENARLKQALEAAQRENAGLAERLKASLAANEETQATVAQLNTDLLAQKQARERAEKAATTLRTQLEAVMARSGRADAAQPESSSATSAASRPAQAVSLSALQSLKAPPSDAAPTAELRASAQSSRTLTASTTITPEVPEPATIAPVTKAQESAPTKTPAPPPRAERRYTVQAGDTLERISTRYYGTPDQWAKIYSANSEVLSSPPGLRPGLELTIPEK